MPPKEPKQKLPLKNIKAAPHSIVFELPQSTYRGIGKIVSAHAILESQVFDLLCQLAQIDHPTGRVTMRYQAASERFKLIKRLLLLHGVTTTTSLNSLLTEIEDCCRLRDTFAHGVWVIIPPKDIMSGESIGLTLTKGEFEAEEGTVDRSFMPQISTFSYRFYEENRRLILSVIDKVADLNEEVAAALSARREASA